MPLDALIPLLEASERVLAQDWLASLGSFGANNREVEVFVTARFVRAARRARCWKSRAMLTALKNAAYGYDPSRPRSRGGRDGIFRVDRTFTPPNAMMRKLYAGFIDQKNGDADLLAQRLGVDRQDFMPVRLVSHHLRLLGVLVCEPGERRLVLIDLDFSG